MGFFEKIFGKTEKLLYAPMVGKSIPLSQVPDPTFAEGMLGDGIAIEPIDGKVYAPCDGVVDMLFPTNHALTLVADFGAEILIHVGLETVSLEGKPFTPHVGEGHRVKKGQLLLEASLTAIRAAGLSTVTPMVICNAQSYSSFETVTGEDVTNSDVLIRLSE